MLKASAIGPFPPSGPAPGNSPHHDPTPPGTGGSRERVAAGFDASQLGGWAVLRAVSRTGSQPQGLAATNGGMLMPRYIPAGASRSEPAEGNGQAWVKP
jgi:hypothetical protein